MNKLALVLQLPPETAGFINLEVTQAQGSPQIA